MAVTNRNDTGPGSLRAALSGGGRVISVNVTGTIDLKSIVYVRSSDVTLLGNGITLTGWPIWLQGAHDVIIRDLRHRGGAGVSQSSDNITLGQGTSRVVLDHLSLSGQGDEAVGIWDRVTDVTISNSLIGPGFAAHNYGILIGEKSHRVSVVRNVLTGIEYRSPAAGWDDRNGTTAPSIVADVVNNVIWDAGYAGTTAYWGGKANVRGNYYQGTSKPLEIGSKGQAFSLGNYSSNGGSLSGNVSDPFAVPGYAILVGADARQNAIALRETVGCRVNGLDALDVILLEDIRP